MSADDAVGVGDVGDLTNSEAFRNINALLEHGTIPEGRAIALKDKYSQLHDRVMQIYRNDNFLLKRARQNMKDLEVEKTKVEKCGENAQKDDKDISALKKELAAAEHELSIAQERESMLQVEALELDRKRQTLTHDVEESIEQEEAKLKPLLKAHADAIKDLGRQIDETAATYDQLKDQREKLLEKETQLKNEIDRQNAVVYETKMELARIEREPDRARKQADIVVRAAATADKEKSNLRDKIEAAKKQMEEGNARKSAMTRQIADVNGTLRTNNEQITQRNSLLEDMTAQLESEREQSNQYQKRKAKLEEELKKAAIAINLARDNLNKTQRDKEQGMKHFKKLEQSKADAFNESEMFRKQLEILNREENRLTQLRAKSAEELEELKREVDILINSFLREEIAEKRCYDDKMEMAALIKKLEDEVSLRSGQEQQLRREASALSIRREQMSRDCSRNVGKCQLAESESTVKDVVLTELEKRLEDLEQHLQEVVDHWHRVKRERSHKAQQIQTNSQTMSETQEKIKILENELEVLRRESLIKDQDLKRKEREHHEHDQICKNLLVEKNRWSKKHETARHKEEDLQQQMSKLNSVITATEDEMLRLKEAYEDAVETRNFTGIQLIDRNDELCILYEKANIQESILKRGMVQLNARDEEIRRNAIDLADLERDVDLCQKALPQVRDLEEELADLMLRLDEERWKAEVLENDLTDPTNTTRWRKIGKVGVDTKPKLKAVPAAPDEAEGSDDMVELAKKRQALEERLARVNEKIMEKDLILEEITELSSRLRRQALNGRDFTLALAKKVNGYQYGIKGKTKRMMATLSELSMVQASSIKLEMDVQAMEARVSEARERFDSGGAPSDDVARQYEKDAATEARRRELTQKRKERAEEELQQFPGATRSTAPQRPNAYMQGDAELMLPQPYGAHGMFMPQRKHNVSRFYRKDKVKDLDFEDD